MPFLAVFGPLDWTVLVVYFALMIAIGALAARGQSGSESFFLGGRTIPAWAASVSVVASSLSAATFIGVPQLSYEGDWTYLIFNVGAILGAFVVALVFIPPLYRAGTITIYGYLDQRLGPEAAIGSSIAFLVGRLLSSGARLYFAAIAFSLILFGKAEVGHVLPAIVLLGAIGTFYTVCGGIRAVIWTDVAQIIVVMGAAGMSIFLLLERIDLPVGRIIELLRSSSGLDKLRVVDTQATLARPFTLWGGVAVTFLYVASYGVDHDLVQRCMATRSAARAGWAMFLSNLLAIPIITMFLVIGSLLFVFHGVHEPASAMTDTRQVYPMFILQYLPTGLAGLAMAGMFASAMSTFDSAVNAMAASAVADIYAPWRRRVSRGAPAEEGHALHAPRLAVVLMGALLTAFAIAAVFLERSSDGTLIDFALNVMTFAYAGMLGVFLTALLTRRGNATSAIAALLVGAGVILLCQPYVLRYLVGEAFTLAMPWSMALGTLVSFAVCAAGAPKSDRQLDGPSKGA